MRALAESDGDVYLPVVEPEGLAPYVLIGMEPSLGWWARSADEARSKVERGFRNFLFSIEDFILHFCIQHYLCGPGERYHLTDLSKGAMLVDHANVARVERYDRWFGLLQEEIDLVATPNALIVAIGEAVATHLRRRCFPRPFTQILHYSGQAGRARHTGIRGHEQRFRDFLGSVSMDDLNTTAQHLFEAARVPREIRDEALLRLASTQLTASRQALIFNYKLSFESMRASGGMAPTVPAPEFKDEAKVTRTRL
jgi:hypothetical protein